MYLQTISTLLNPFSTLYLTFPDAQIRHITQIDIVNTNNSQNTKLSIAAAIGRA